MVSRVTLLDEKDPAEVIAITWDFAADAGGVAISAPVTALAVLSGADPDVAQMPLGAPQVTGSEVRQLMRNGVAGVNYSARCTVDLADGRRLVLAGVLPVRTA